MIVPPMMCLLWANLVAILTSVAPIASAMRLPIGTEYTSADLRVYSPTS